MNDRYLVSMIVLFVFVATALAGCDDDDGDDGSHPDGIGNSCSEDADCEIGECYLGPGGGYCTTECENEGATISECPVDTVCKPIQGGQASCLLICGSESSCQDLDDRDDDYCPDGSSCVTVSETDYMACEPDPN